MLEFFSFLLTLGTALKVIFEEMNYPAAELRGIKGV
jgi:hypothetical protein